MNCKPKAFTIEEIVNAWNDTSLKANPEYQRGAAWKGHQQQALIDSVFRLYPIPPLFLHEITAKGLGGHTSVRYEVVDGQQRIRAFADYLGDKYQLLSPDDRKLRLPTSFATWTPACPGASCRTTAGGTSSANRSHRTNRPVSARHSLDRRMPGYMKRRTSLLSENPGALSGY